MTSNTTPVNLEFTFRHFTSSEAVKEYSRKRLDKVVQTLPDVRTADIEFIMEATSPSNMRFIVQATLVADETVIRAEHRGPDPQTAIDGVHDLLERRISDWKGRVYFLKRREAAAEKDALLDERTATPPLAVEEGGDGFIVRIKNHETKPMFPEDAVEQMELLGHDFYFFYNADSGRHNVVYRRKAGGYGLIEPTLPAKT